MRHLRIVSDSNRKCFRRLRTDLKGVICQEASSQTWDPQWVLLRSGRHQHGKLLQGRWKTVLMEVVTPQTDRGGGDTQSEEVQSIVKGMWKGNTVSFTPSHIFQVLKLENRSNIYAKIECPGSFPPTMPCTSGVGFIELASCAPGGLKGEEGVETSWWRQGVQRDDRSQVLCQAPRWHLAAWEDLGEQDTALPHGG